MILFLAAAVLEDNGDLELFYRLFDKYKNIMFNNAYAILRDRQLAEDAVNDAFEGILRNFETVKTLPDPAMDAYFIKSARNAALDHFKKRKLRWDNELPLDDCEVNCGAWDGTFTTVSRIIDREAVKKALNMMDIVEERGMEIDSHRLPEMLGIPVVPVSARKKRGLDILMHAVAHHMDDDEPANALIHEHGDTEESTHVHDHHSEYAMVYSDEIEDKIDAITVELKKHYPDMKNVRAGCRYYGSLSDSLA